MSTELKPQDGVLIEFQAGHSLEGLQAALVELGRGVGAETLSAHREQDGTRVAAYLWGAASMMRGIAS